MKERPDRPTTTFWTLGTGDDAPVYRSASAVVAARDVHPVAGPAPIPVDVHLEYGPMLDVFVEGDGSLDLRFELARLIFLVGRRDAGPPPSPEVVDLLLGPPPPPPTDTRHLRHGERDAATS
ncbi:MAG: hypothetical protein S0880_08305 [Actinomycetota bacterium]|nr:hypothetical protein [Actinomycetota bacterium]